MNPPAALLDFVAEMVHSHPGAHLEFRPNASGVCFLWITLRERHFVIEYDPHQGAGVSENFAATPPFVGHDHFFPKLEDGLEKMRGYLRDASRARSADFQAA